MPFIYFLTFSGRFAGMQNVIEYNVPTVIPQELRNFKESEGKKKAHAEIEHLILSDSPKCHSRGSGSFCSLHSQGIALLLSVLGASLLFADGGMFKCVVYLRMSELSGIVARRKFPYKIIHFDLFVSV